MVFLPGAGLVGLDFLNVHADTAARTTSVLYDRAGTGWSDPVDLPRTPAAVAGELREVLRASGVAAPHVLAGHSLGAFYARRYAQLFPDDVAALLLLDPGHEDMTSYLTAQAAELSERMKADPAAMPDLTPEQLEASRAAYAKLYAQWPARVRDHLIGHHLASWRTGVHEVANFETEVYDELRGGGPLPDVPLLVLTAAGGNPYWAQFASEELVREALDGVRTLHAAIPRSVPRGEQRIVEGASHQFMQIEHPEAVHRAIADLLGRTAAPPG